MEKKWQKFERIVAAIHAAEAEGAEVTWNENIDGRQFDVVMRFKMGFYDYLTLIECKDYKKPVKAEKVDAFVTKSRTARANKAIMVSASGFQDGGKKVARKENIELYTFREIQSMPSATFLLEFASILVIDPIGFLRSDKPEQYLLSSCGKDINYLMDNIRLATMGNKTIGEIMAVFSQQLTAHEMPGVTRFGGNFKVATFERQRMNITLPFGSKAVIPETNEEIPVSKFGFYYWMEKMDVVKRTIFDSEVISTLQSKFEYKDEINDTTQIVEAVGLEFGIDTTLEVGKFYTQPPLNFSYLVESIVKNLVQLFVVESYQHGRFIQMRFTQDIKFQHFYVEITDKDEIKRLQRLYDSLDEDKGIDPRSIDIYSVEPDKDTGSLKFTKAPVNPEKF